MSGRASTRGTVLIAGAANVFVGASRRVPGPVLILPEDRSTPGGRSGS
jgi:hypothetical protein